VSKNGDAQESWPELHLEIGYYDLPDARESGKLIEQIAAAFANAGDDGRTTQLRLQLTRTEISSLHAFFKIGNALFDLSEQREFLIAFVGRLGVSLRVFLDASGGTVPPSIRNLFLTLATTVDAGRASHAKIHVYGDNNTIIIIEKTEANTLRTILTPPKLAKEYILKEVAPEPKTTPTYIASQPLDRNKFPDGSFAMGSLISVNGAPHVRLDGSRGAILPAEGVPNDLNTTLPISVEGNVRWSRNRNESHVFVVSPIRLQ